MKQKLCITCEDSKIIETTDEHSTKHEILICSKSEKQKAAYDICIYEW